MPIPSVQVPVLKEPENPSHVFPPFSYVVRVHFAPSLPIPCEVGVRFVFSDGDGVTCRGEGDPLNLELMDLMTPITVPQGLDCEEMDRARKTIDDPLLVVRFPVHKLLIIIVVVGYGYFIVVGYGF